MTPVRVTAEAGLTGEQLAGDWDLACLAHHPARQALLCRDARWDAGLLAAWDGDRLVGCAVLARPTVPALTDPELRQALDRCAPELTDSSGVLLLGSPVEYASGIALAHDLRLDPAEVRRAMVAAAVQAAAGRRLRLGTLFAESALVDELISVGAPGHGPAAVPLTERAWLAGPFADFEQYLSAQSRDRRAMIRRELRTIARLGLTAEVTGLDDALARGAAELIAELKRRHGLPEAPRLVRLRVERWARTAQGTVRAIEVRAGGQVVAVALTQQSDRHHEVYEVGLAEDFEHRIHAYTLACFYEPVRLLVEQRGTVLDLGVGTTEAKTLRGAHLEQSYGYVSARP